MLRCDLIQPVLKNGTYPNQSLSKCGLVKVHAKESIKGTFRIPDCQKMYVTLSRYYKMA